MVIEGYKHISTVADTAIQKMKDVRSGLVKPLFTSSQKETDKIGGFYFSDQVVIAARPGTGKTARLIQLMSDFVNWNLNPHYKDKIILLYDSLEMADWRNILRMVSRKAEIEVKALLDHAKKLEEDRFNTLLAIAATFKGMPIYINTMPRTVGQWVESKKQIQGKFPDKRIINFYDHTRLILKGEESKEEERLTGLMFGGVYLKNNFDMMNFFLSQMNRNIETGVSREKIGTMAPVASDIFGSDAVYQSADVVIALHRPGIYGIETFEDFPTGISKADPNQPDDLLVECILKQREGWTGNLYMRHNLAINKIEDYPFMQNLNSRPNTSRLIETGF